eukprot:scaffold46609_cov65-Attheya_sp.AAC.4
MPRAGVLLLGNHIRVTLRTNTRCGNQTSRTPHPTRASNPPPNTLYPTSSRSGARGIHHAQQTNTLKMQEDPLSAKDHTQQPLGLGLEGAIQDAG